MTNAYFRYDQVIVDVLHGIEIKFSDSYKMFQFLFYRLWTTDGWHHKTWKGASSFMFESG